MIIREYRPFVVMPIRMVNDKNLLGIDYRVYGCMLHAIENDEKLVDCADVGKELSRKLNENIDDINQSLSRLELQKYIKSSKNKNDELVIEVFDE